MQYFTFVGMGDLKKKQYKEVIYDFNGELTVSKFVQEPIFEHFKESIDEVDIIATQEAYDWNGKQLEQLLVRIKPGVSIKHILIPNTLTFENTVQLLVENIQQDFIMDVTHSYRDMPMTVLLSMDYIIASKKCTVCHLFYGKIGSNHEEFKIVDIIDEYHLASLGNDLKQFQKTLRIDLDPLYGQYEENKEISKFYKAVQDFNTMLELSDFERSIADIERIYKAAKKIYENTEKYYLLSPFISEILTMLEPVCNAENGFFKKKALIRILFEHDLIQIAITFADQLIREELIHYTVNPQGQNYSSSNLKYEKTIPEYKNRDVYLLSQHLILEVYQLRKANLKKNAEKTGFEDFENQYKQNIQENQAIFGRLDIKPLVVFYKDIRNKINHGSKITMEKEKIKSIISESIDIIQSLIRKEHA